MCFILFYHRFAGVPSELCTDPVSLDGRLQPPRCFPTMTGGWRQLRPTDPGRVMHGNIHRTHRFVTQTCCIRIIASMSVNLDKTTNCHINMIFVHIFAFGEGQGKFSRWKYPTSFSPRDFRVCVGFVHNVPTRLEFTLQSTQLNLNRKCAKILFELHSDSNFQAFESC